MKNRRFPWNSDGTPRGVTDPGRGTPLSRPGPAPPSSKSPRPPGPLRGSHEKPYDPPLPPVPVRKNSDEEPAFPLDFRRNGNLRSGKQGGYPPCCARGGGGLPEFLSRSRTGVGGPQKMSGGGPLRGSKGNPPGSKPGGTLYRTVPVPDWRDCSVPGPGRWKLWEVAGTAGPSSLPPPQAFSPVPSKFPVRTGSCRTTGFSQRTRTRNSPGSR